MAIPRHLLETPQAYLIETMLETNEPHLTYNYRPFDIVAHPREYDVLSDRAYVDWDGTFYQITIRDEAEEAISPLTLRARKIDPDDDTDVVDASEYPAFDVPFIEQAIYREKRRQLFIEQHEGTEHGHESDFLVTLPQRESIPDHSELVPEPAHPMVTLEGEEAYELTVEERTFEGTRYTWDIATIAYSRAQFVDFRDRELVDGSYDDPPLSENEAAFVESMRKSTESEYRPYPDELISLAARVGVTIDEEASYETLERHTERRLVEYNDQYWTVDFSLLEY